MLRIEKIYSRRISKIFYKNIMETNTIGGHCWLWQLLVKYKKSQDILFKKKKKQQQNSEN